MVEQKINREKKPKALGDQVVEGIIYLHNHPKKKGEVSTTVSECEPGTENK